MGIFAGSQLLQGSKWVVVPLGGKNPDFPVSRRDVRPLTTDPPLDILGRSLM